MRKEEIAEVVRLTTAEVLSQRDAIMEEEFDARYHDVNLLMKNYRKLKAHYANVAPEALEVSSICSMRRKTKLMMSHVDKMLTAYEAMCLIPTTLTRPAGGTRFTCGSSEMKG